VSDELDRGGFSQPPPPAPPPPQPLPPPAYPPAGPERDAAARGWGPAQAVLGVFAAIVFLFLGGLVVYAIAGDSGLDFTIGNQLVLEAAFLGTAVIFVSASGAPSVIRALGLRAPRPGWIGLTIGAFFGYLLLALLFASLLADPEQIDVADELGFDTSTFGAISAGILIVGLAPLAEEVFFRGFFYGGLRSRMPAWTAAAVSGLFFGFIHITTGNLAVVAQLTMLGIVLALLYERTGSLWPPILVHLVNNALAFTVLVSS
jgi:hypothetical protein